MPPEKGQFNIEYMVALVIFVSIIIFLSFQLAQAVPEFHTNSVNNRLRAQAYRAAETLWKTPGEPSRWERSNASVYGFAESPFLINETKLTIFNQRCLDAYSDTKDRMGIDRRADFQIQVFVNNSPAVDCGQQRIPQGATQTLVRRRGYTAENELAEMRFSVWV